MLTVKLFTIRLTKLLRNISSSLMLMKYDLYCNDCFNSYVLTRMQSLHQQHDFCVS